MTMEAVGVIQYNSGKAVNMLNCVGNLRWSQKANLIFGRADNRYNQSVFDSFEISQVLNDYSARNCKYLNKEYYFTAL